MWYLGRLVDVDMKKCQTANTLYTILKTYNPNS